MFSIHVGINWFLPTTTSLYIFISSFILLHHPWRYSPLNLDPIQSYSWVDLLHILFVRARDEFCLCLYLKSIRVHSTLVDGSMLMTAILMWGIWLMIAVLCEDWLKNRVFCWDRDHDRSLIVVLKRTAIMIAVLTKNLKIRHFLRIATMVAVLF